MKKTSKQPMRRCIGCMTSKPKKELVRLVVHDGELTGDPGAKQSGRGAYLCHNEECLDKALKRHAFKRVLGREPSSEEVERLRNLIKDDNGAFKADDCHDTEVTDGD